MLNTDEMRMAEGIVSSIIRDGAGTAFLSGTEDQQKDIMFAYFDAEIKKFEKFQTKMITNPEARDAFIMAVFEIM